MSMCDCDCVCFEDWEDCDEEGEGEEVKLSVLSPKMALMDSISSLSVEGIDVDGSSMP